MPPGSLTVVGTGIQLGVQLTPEARAALRQADEVLYLVGDLAAVAWIQRINPRARSLHAFYRDGEPCRMTYEAMVEEILTCVRRGRDVCVAFYGHPGVFVTPSHESIRRAREEGYAARMLPAVSAEDCLFADLGVDPGENGCQSYEATDFVLRRRRIDPSAAVILWQVGVVGVLHHVRHVEDARVTVLVDYLLEYYAPDHEAILYEAAPYPAFDPVVRRMPLASVASAPIGKLATMYLAPAEAREPDPEMLRRLGIEHAALRSAPSGAGAG